MSAILAHRVAVSVVPSLGAKRARTAADPFAEPADGQAAVPGGAGVPAPDGGAAAESAAGAPGGQATALLDPEPRPYGGRAGMSGLRRVALVFGIVSLLLFADGTYLLATHNNVGGDTGILFGNPNYYLSAGTVVVISALFVLVASVIMWLVDVRREDKERRPAGDPPSAASSPGRQAERHPGRELCGSCRSAAR